MMFWFRVKLINFAIILCCINGSVGSWQFSTFAAVLNELKPVDRELGNDSSASIGWAWSGFNLPPFKNFNINQHAKVCSASKRMPIVQLTVAGSFYIVVKSGNNVRGSNISYGS